MEAEETILSEARFYLATVFLGQLTVLQTGWPETTSAAAASNGSHGNHGGNPCLPLLASYTLPFVLAVFVSKFLPCIVKDTGQAILD